MSENGGDASSTSSTPRRPTTSKKKSSENSRNEADKIQVCVRIRPLNQKEIQINKTPVWRVTQQNTVYLCNPQTGLADSSSPLYTFDHAFSPEITTEVIYDQVAKDIVVSAMRGFNGTIFAYGQTSSGKTHTMKGSKAEPGIIQHAIQEIFNYITQNPQREFLLRVSYLEIYNEVIMDLLEPTSTNLKIHEDMQRGVFVGNLKEEVISSPEQVYDLMEEGERNRHYGATNMNERSSRSHTIFRIVMESREKRMTTTGAEEESDDGSNPVLVSALNLVDLAGSERAAHTQAEGGRLVEGGYINKSLLTLGTVISKLSEGVKQHIPYRDSKLTRILQPALGGNSRTSIICTVTPAIQHTDETHSTLKFANRAKNITNKAHINEIMNDQVAMKKFQKETDEWKEKCRDLEDRLYESQRKNGVFVAQIEEYKQSIAKFKLMEEQYSAMDQLRKQLEMTLSFTKAQLDDKQSESDQLKMKCELLQLQVSEDANAHSSSMQQLQEALQRQAAAFELERQQWRQWQQSQIQAQQQAQVVFEKEKQNAVQTAVDQVTEELTREIQELNGRIDELEEEKTDKLYHNHESIEVIASLKRRIKTLETENEHLKRLNQHKQAKKVVEQTVPSNLIFAQDENSFLSPMKNNHNNSINMSKRRTTMAPLATLRSVQ